MALAPRDMPITREQVHGWLQEYDGQLKPTKKLRDYLVKRVEELNLEDDMVDTRNHDQLDDSTSVVDMILMDVYSYV